MVLDERHGSSTILTRSAIQALSNVLDGEVILPDDALRWGAARVSPGATAFPHRHLPYSVLALAQWMDPAMAGPMTGWVREAVDTFYPITGGVYVNGADDEPVRSIYGSNYQRLPEVRNRYDPTNFFASNINIEPTL